MVELPGQHISEEAFLEASHLPSPPVASRLAGPSRLAFELPPSTDRVPLTLESLLDWRRWSASLPPRGPGAASARPAREETAIEMPARLVVSPHEDGAWRHATRPLTHAGRTALWHTRLVSPHALPPELTAVWSPDLSEPGTDAVTTALSARDRRDLVGKTARARSLVLSSMGGWLDIEGAWEGTAESRLEKWRHVATAGQDQRVVVQRGGGFLFPFGHRAALVEVTERRLEESESGSVAILCRRHFVVVKQPRAEYRHGAMAFRSLTAVDRVTPSLRFAPEDSPTDLKQFWIETGDGPFLFRFRAEDWAGRDLFLEAPAVFLSHDGDPAPARALYEDPRYEDRRVSPMRSQSAAVVRFEPADAGDTDRWGDPLTHERSLGDTTLRLLQVGFSVGPAEAVPGAPPFSARTASMQVSVPALDPYLEDHRNRGWFTLVDPDTPDNLGEVFARIDARRDDPPIPLHFDRQSDRCGGLASPSFDVAGLSRVRGPVGDTAPLYRGGGFDPERYFDPEHARLLGGLPLSRLLSASTSPAGGDRSPAVPRISFSLDRVTPEPEEEETPEPYWEVGLGLSWTTPLESGPGDLVSFIAGGEDTALTLSARLTKRLGGADAPSSSRDSSDSGSEEGHGVDWSVSGRLDHFGLRLGAGPLGSLTIGFEHLALKLSTPKTKTKEGREQKTGGAEVDFRFSGVRGEGPLVFLDFLLALLTHRPRLPERPEVEVPPASVATLPDVESADIGVTLGPFRVPKTVWRQFEVSNADASVGLGLFFDERPALFTLRLASPDKPLTLMAEPWGGLAHLGLNFSSRRLVGFQAGLGIAYRLKVDLAGAPAKVEGSLSCTFTFLLAEEGPRHQVALVLRVVGEATILGFVEVRLALRAAGVWDDGPWVFEAVVTVRVKIGFFAVQESFRFAYRISGDERDTHRLAAAPATGPGTPALNETEWREYTAAFAEGRP